MNEQINCKRLGHCCYFTVNGKRHKCKFLVRTKNSTLCRIYKTRLGTVIYQKDDYIVRCGHRIDQKMHHPGCPYNAEISLNDEKV